MNIFILGCYVGLNEEIINLVCIGFLIEARFDIIVEG